MPSLLKPLLRGEHENHLLPFFWQHGESEAVLRETIAKIAESHIGAVCVESRPHPDFVGPRWWHDMDIIMDECRRRGMKVWVLDDASFPTGYAAGKVRRDRPGEGKYFLKETRVDVMGPESGTSLIVPIPEDGRLVRVLACRHTNGTLAVDGDFIDLTDRVTEDLVYWDIPEGFWRVYYLYYTQVGNTNTPALDNYLNPLTAQGTQVLIDTVYEPHFERYGADFGKTFLGFFSDEPQFGEVDGNSVALGRIPNMPILWCDALDDMMKERLGEEAPLLYPGLWHDIGPRTQHVRYAYMDSVSTLYGKNFAGRLGDWCRAHGVSYIGHVIEDNNAHVRLGNGTGHFFRSLWGQDYSGIDIVLQMLLPGMKGILAHERDPAQSTYENACADNDFYHYALARLGASLGHLDPKKKGRIMCEVFGGYGWVEGLKLMKWLADFMLVRGVNYFVPHAFSPKAFPDPDGPPHFYARGKNPQFRYFWRLMDYMNRVSNLTSDGTHIATAAVLYHGEAAWCNPGTMPFERVAKVLNESQIDCDVVCADMLLSDAARIENGKLAIASENFEILILPEAEAIPAALLERLCTFADLGLPVVFTNRAPRRLCIGNAEDEARLLPLCSRFPVLQLQDLAGYLTERGMYDVRLDTPCPDLRIYHYRKGTADCYLLFNESDRITQEAQLTVCDTRVPVRYDAYENRAELPPFLKEETATVLPIRLAPYEATIFLFGEETAGLPPAKAEMPCTALALPLHGWSVSTAESEAYPAFTPCTLVDGPENLNAPGKMPHFVGTIRYERDLVCAASGCMLLDLGDAGETAEVFLDGESRGVRLTPPYRFSLGELDAGRAYHLAVEVTNTPVYRVHDKFSVYQPIHASGLIGPVTLLSKEK